MKLRNMLRKSGFNGMAMLDKFNTTFKPGDKVKVREGSTPFHIRTPWFVQGKIGEIETYYGSFRNPETLAYGAEGLPVIPLYRVKFKQSEVWESYKGSTDDQICVDLYHHWLLG